MAHERDDLSMSFVRAVIAGADDNMLAEIVERVSEHRLPLEVVGRTDEEDVLVSMSRERRADLVLLIEAANGVGRHYGELRTRLGDAALVVIGRDGRRACACIDNPGIRELVELIGLACGTRRIGRELSS